jgi:hypothetical protein
MNGTLFPASRLSVFVALLAAPAVRPIVLAESSQDRPAEALTAVPFYKVRMTDRFLQPRLATHAAVTIPYVLDRTQESLGDLRK